MGDTGVAPIEAMIGRDLSPVLVGNAERVYGADDAVGYELAGNAALFQGDYKIVVNRKPLGDGEWRLFNIKKDPGETRDLAQEEPTRLQQMLSAYERYQRENKVLDMPAGVWSHQAVVDQYAASAVAHPVAGGASHPAHPVTLFSGLPYEAKTLAWTSRTSSMPCRTRSTRGARAVTSSKIAFLLRSAQQDTRASKLRCCLKANCPPSPPW